MHAPLLFAVFIYLHFYYKAENSKWAIAVEWFLGIIGILILMLSIMPLMLDRTQMVDRLYFKSISLIIASAFICYLYYKNANHRILSIIILLFIARIGFNWFVLPDRYQNDWGTQCKISSISIGEETKGRNLFLYRNTGYTPTNAFYITRAREAILTRSYQKADLDNFYIIKNDFYPDVKIELLDYLKMRQDSAQLEFGKVTFEPKGEIMYIPN